MANENSNPVQVQKRLGGVDYPASKQDLIDHVKNNGGKNDEVIDILKKLPEKQYKSPIDVTKAIGDLK